METQLRRIDNDGTRTTTIKDWSVADCLKKVAKVNENLSQFVIEGKNFDISYDGGRVSIIAGNDLSIHFDDDEITDIIITSYENETDVKVEFYTARAEFHITVWV